MRARNGIVCLLSLIFCVSTFAKDQKVQRKSFLGKTPPEIVAEDEHWLGPHPPVTLAALKGKVVWLQFNF